MGSWSSRGGNSFGFKPFRGVAQPMAGPQARLPCLAEAWQLQERRPTKSEPKPFPRNQPLALDICRLPRRSVPRRARRLRQHELLLIASRDLLVVVSQGRVLFRIQQNKRARKDVLDIESARTRR